jgi:RTX calcium-binding nonapeptide repeat (4 copies)
MRREKAGTCSRPGGQGWKHPVIFFRIRTLFPVAMISSLRCGRASNGTRYLLRLKRKRARTPDQIGAVEEAAANNSTGFGVINTTSSAAENLYNDIYGTGGSQSGGGNTPGTILDSNTGEITGMITPSCVAGGTYIPADVGLEIDHPWIITSFWTQTVDNVTTTTTTAETFLKQVDFVSSLAPSDVLLSYTPSSDTLTVHVGGTLNTTINLPDFVSGKTIAGTAQYDSVYQDVVQAAGTNSLTASSADNFSVNYNDDISSYFQGLAYVTVTYYLETFAFAGGTFWNMQANGLTFTGTAGGQTVYARDGFSDTLVAQNTQEALYAANGGDTTMVAYAGSQLHNGDGNDTDVFSVGTAPSSGDLVYANASGGSNNVILFHGITADQVTMSDTTTGHLIIQTTDSSSDKITIYGGIYNSTTGFTPANMSDLILDDGTHIALGGGLNLTATTNSLSLYGTVGGGDTLTALATSDVLYAYGGDETLVAGVNSSLHNGTGNDTDVFSVGTSPSGGDIIYANANGGSNNVVLFHGITADQVTMYDDSYGHLTIHTTDSSSDKITIYGGSYSSTTGFTEANMSCMTLDDSTNIALTGGLDLTATSNSQSLYGTVGGGDTLTALGTNDILYAYGGPETLVAGVGSTLHNGTGSATDVFSAGTTTGSGDKIYTNANGTAVIDLHGIDPGAVTISDNTSGQFIIQFSASDKITVYGGSYSSTTGDHIGNISQINFDDSTVWNLSGSSLDLTATANRQYLYGTGYGDTMTALGSNDYLYGIAGNNTMYGDSYTTYFYGGSGNDLMIGGSGTNYMHAGTGTDTFKIEDAGSTNTVYSFSTAHSDVINVSDVISGYDPVNDSLGDWVQATTSGSNTLISVDPTGTGTFSHTLVTISGVTGLGDAATMVANGELVVHA